MNKRENCRTAGESKGRFCLPKESIPIKLYCRSQQVSARPERPAATGPLPDNYWLVITDCQKT